MFLKFVNIVFLFCFVVSGANAIVNLDTLHLGEKQTGFSGDVSFGLNGAMGYRDRFRLSSVANAQWNRKNLLYYLSFNYGYGESVGVEDENKGFLHARRIKNVSQKIAWELFSQVEQNKFARLNFRGLLGGGTRYALNNNEKKQVTFLGLGGFFSREDLTNSSTTTDDGIEDIWRANLYLLERLVLNKNISIFETLYFQPSVAEPQDFRILNIVGLKSKITKRFSMRFSLEIIHDSDPPQGVVKTDSNYFTRLEYEF